MDGVGQPTTLTIPLFPLPNVVFFPKTFLPLHIFEPRYRAMVRDASAGDQLIGMVLLKDRWERDDEEAPPTQTVGCMGKIVALDPLEDGRYNLILFGLRRFAIESEVLVKPYREAQVRGEAGAQWHTINEELKEKLTETFQRIARLHALSQELAQLMQIADDPEVLVNLLSSDLPFTTVEKQFLLESSSLEQQARRLLDLIELRKL